MKITIEIDDSKGKAFLEFLRLLDFVKISVDGKQTDQSDWPDIE